MTSDSNTPPLCKPGSSTDHIQYSQSLSQIQEPWTREGLGEHVCNIVCSGKLSYNQLPLVDAFMDQMIMDIEMFGMVVERLIGTEQHCSGIVA